MSKIEKNREKQESKHQLDKIEQDYQKCLDDLRASKLQGDPFSMTYIAFLLLGAWTLLKIARFFERILDKVE